MTDVKNYFKPADFGFFSDAKIRDINETIAEFVNSRIQPLLAELEQVKGENVRARELLKDALFQLRQGYDLVGDPDEFERVARNISELLEGGK